MWRSAESPGPRRGRRSGSSPTRRTTPPVALAEKNGADITTITGLQGKPVGTVTGYIFVNAIRQIPGATLHAYQDAPSAFTDLAEGRVNALVIDTLLVIYQAKQDAGSGLTSDYLAPPSAADLQAHPAYSAFEPYMTGFYVPKQEPKLVAAMDKVIRQMYANGVMAKYLAKWGAKPSLFLKPSPGIAQERHAVDRPASWTPSSAEGSLGCRPRTTCPSPVRTWS